MRYVVRPALGLKAWQRMQRRMALFKRYEELEREEGIAGQNEIVSCSPDKRPARRHYGGTKDVSRSSRCDAENNESYGNTGHKNVPKTTKLGSGKHTKSALVTQPSRRSDAISESRHVVTSKTGFSRCCRDENDMFEKALQVGNDDEVVYLQDSNIHLKGFSFKRLRRNCWLDDELVNGFVGMLNKRSSRRRVEKIVGGDNDVPRTVMMSSFLFTKLIRDEAALTENGVLQWTTRKNIDIPSYHLILVPLHLHGNHWALCCIDILHREFVYIDSLYDKDVGNAVPALKKWLHAELRFKKGLKVAKEYKVVKWNVRENSYRIARSTASPVSRESHHHDAHATFGQIPKQNDDSSCGVFMLKFADCLARAVPLDFTDKDIDLYRKELGLSLLRGSLPL